MSGAFQSPSKIICTYSQIQKTFFFSFFIYYQPSKHTLIETWLKSKDGFFIECECENTEILIFLAFLLWTHILYSKLWSFCSSMSLTLLTHYFWRFIKTSPNYTLLAVDDRTEILNVPLLLKTTKKGVNYYVHIQNNSTSYIEIKMVILFFNIN